MKKRITLTLLLLMLYSFVVSSCGFEKVDFSDTYNPETDSQYTYIPQGAPSTIAETKEGYYFLAGSYLYYAGKNDRKPIILCNKPNCLHNSETDAEKTLNCNALFWGTNTCVAYNNGHLYVAGMSFTADKSTACLQEVSLDGTRRKTISELGESVPLSLVVHRGYAYYASTSYDKSGKSIYGVKRVSLRKINTEPEELYKGTLINGNIQDLLCYGKNLYFTEVGSNGKITVTKCMRIDLKSKTSYRMLSNNDEEYVSQPIISNKRLYQSILHISKEGMIIDTKNYSSNLNGDDLKSGFDFITKACGFSDEKYLYTYTAPWLSLEKGEKYILSVYDWNGKLIDSMDTSFLGTQGRIIGGGDKDLFIIKYTDTMYQILTVNKALIGSGKMKPELLFEIEKDKLTHSVLITPK